MNNNTLAKKMASTAYYLLLFIFCGALAVSGLFKMFDVAKAYERSSPEYISRYVLSFFEEKRYSEIMALSKVSLSKYENAERFAAAVKNAAPEGEYACLRSGESSYRLKRGKVTLGELSLSCKKGAGEYGLDIWTADSLKLLAIETDNYIIRAPASVMLTVNGVSLGEGNSDAAASKAEFEALCIEFGSPPEALFPDEMRIYRLNGLYSPPLVSAVAQEGQSCEVGINEQEITVALTPSLDSMSELIVLGEQAACMYARFITNDATRAEVLPYFLPKTEYYKYLSEFYNGWYNDHDSYLFENTAFSEWRMFDAAHISCNVNFDYRITMGRHEYSYPSKYVMYFINTDGGWKISNLTVI